MPLDPAALDRRLALTTSADTVRGLIFNSAFARARALGGGAAALACDPAGKAKRVDFLSYPAADYLRVAWAVLARSPDAPPARSFRALGAAAAQYVLASLLGKTFVSLAAGEVRRIVEQVPSGYAATVSYGDRKVRWVGDAHALLEFRRDFMPPEFHCGVIEEVARALGAKDPSCAPSRPLAFMDYDLDLRWS